MPVACQSHLWSVSQDISCCCDVPYLYLMCHINISRSGRRLSWLTFLHGFPLSLQANARIVTRTTTTSSHIHSHLVFMIIQSVNTILYYNLLTTLLNTLKRMKYRLFISFLHPPSMHWILHCYLILACTLVAFLEGILEEYGLLGCITM
jgi:hypothetical protein